MADVGGDRLAELQETLRSRYPNAPYDPDSDPVICQECLGAIDDHKANCAVLDIYELLGLLAAPLQDKGEHEQDKQIVIDGVLREVIECPDGIEGCEVLHLKPLAATPVSTTEEKNNA